MPIIDLRTHEIDDIHVQTLQALDTLWRVSPDHELLLFMTYVIGRGWNERERPDFEERFNPDGVLERREIRASYLDAVTKAIGNSLN